MSGVTAPRVRVRGHWPVFGHVFMALSRVPVVGMWLAQAAAWPVHRWVLAYWIDGERL